MTSPSQRVSDVKYMHPQVALQPYDMQAHGKSAAFKRRAMTHPSHQAISRARAHYLHRYCFQAAEFQVGKLPEEHKRYLVTMQ